MRVSGALPLLLGAVGLVGTLGCAAARAMPEVDLGKPGWTVWRGQARWQRAGDRPALTGELVLARNGEGDVLVDFAKPPFPIFTAQTRDRRWWLRFIDSGRARSGAGGPPRRFIWFFVPGILSGAEPPRGWQATRAVSGAWTITRDRSGETITLVLDE